MCCTMPAFVSRCHHGMARPEVADGADVLQIWKVVVNL